MGREDNGENKSHLSSEIQTLLFITWGFLSICFQFFYIGRKAYY